MKKIIKYARPYYMHIIIAAIASVGSSVASVKVIDILKLVIDKAVYGGIVAEMPQLVFNAVVVILLGVVSNYLVVAMTGFCGAGILRDLRKDSLNHIMKASPDFMEKNNFGDTIERLSSDISDIAGYMQTYFKECLYVPVIVVVFAVYLMSLDTFLAVVSLVLFVILVPLSIKLLKPVKLSQAEYVKMLGMTNNNIQEAFDGADVIKSYNLQSVMAEKYYIALKETLDISNKNDLRQYNIEPLSALIREAPTAIALCVGGYLAFSGNVTIGMLVAFISAIEKINEPLVGAYQLVVRTQMAMISVERVFYVMDLPVEAVEGKATHIDKKNDIVFELKNVSFAYGIENILDSNVKMGDARMLSKKVMNEKAIKEKAIDNVNLSIKRGQRVALVGRSGCGKSTIIKLLCRQYEVLCGEIMLYGNRYVDISPVSVRNEIALISQDAIIFPMSVYDNIRIGNPDADREMILNAAKMAGCDEFIKEMPDGYDTIMEEKGSNLSGGQRQRISIARAILKDAPILLLDEPTSALDRETEEHISKTLMGISKNKTVIMVAHRLSTITDYDVIIVMADGRMVEKGTHDELLERRGRYCDMFNEYMMSGGVEQ